MVSDTRKSWQNRVAHPNSKRILKELRELQQKEKLNPKDDNESRIEFLKRLDWADTLFNENEKDAVEDILVEYHDIFARHRMDIGMNTEFKVRLTPKDDKAVYSQSPPTPIHLIEDLIVELAIMHKYGIITVLPFSKYASPIFAQRKPNGKLRLLVDLRFIFIKSWLVKTWLLTLAGLPCASAKSKRHHYKQISKTEGRYGKMVFNGKTVWRFQTKREQELYSRPFEKPSRTQGPWKRQLNKAFVNNKG